MQSPSASSGDFLAKYSQFFGLIDALPDEPQLLQNATSCRMPLSSTHMYFEQLRRMRGSDALRDVQLAESNRFQVDGNDQANTGAIPLSRRQRLLASATAGNLPALPGNLVSLPELPNTTDWLAGNQAQIGCFQPLSRAIETEAAPTQRRQSRRFVAPLAASAVAPRLHLVALNNHPAAVDLQLPATGALGRPAPDVYFNAANRLSNNFSVSPRSLKDRRKSNADQAELRQLIEESRKRQVGRITARLRHNAPPSGFFSAVRRICQTFCQKALMNHQVVCMYFHDFQSLSGTIKGNSR